MARGIGQLEALTEKWEPRIRQAFLNSVRRITSDAEISEIVRLLEAGNIQGVIDHLGITELTFQELELEMEAMYRDGGQEVLRAQPRLGRIIFDVRNIEAEQWVRQRSSNRVTEIVADQRQMIRNNLQAGLEAGQNPRTSALQLVGTIDRATGQRQGGVIGLTSGQEAWQRSYAAEISSTDPGELQKALARKLRDKRFDRAVHKAIRTGEPIPAETQSKMRAAYRNRSLKYRGDVIARTETLGGLRHARHEAYRQAIERGELRPEQITKTWRSAGDARVRDSHASSTVNGQTIPFNEPFVTILGSRLLYPGDTSLGARKEDIIQCRCDAFYRVKFE